MQNKNTPDSSAEEAADNIGDSPDKKNTPIKADASQETSSDSPPDNFADNSADNSAETGTADGNKTAAVDLGKRLRAARLQKSLTLDTVSEELKIREHYLRAFEKADYENLPEANYAVGFLRTYAGYLELPVDETVQDFRQAFGERKQNTQISGLQEVPKSHTSLHYIFLVAVVLCVGLYIFWLGYSQASPTEPSDCFLATGLNPPPNAGNINS